MSEVAKDWLDEELPEEVIWDGFMKRLRDIKYLVEEIQHSEREREFRLEDLNEVKGLVEELNDILRTGKPGPEHKWWAT
jgi:hypothetical protein